MKLSLCALSLILLFFGFYSNSWNVAEQQWFLHYQQDSESLIIGRMVKSRQDGLFSAGGLPGFSIPTDINLDWISTGQIRDQYSAYFNGAALDEYTPYMSQIGGQGMIFSLLDSVVPFSPQEKLKLFYLLTSLLSAVALTLVVLWFYCEFGLSAALFVLASMVLSQWLTVFGRNLWWGLWAFYLPMVAVMYFLKYRRTPTNRHFITFGFLSFIAIFLKCLINGYEYITTTLIMMVIPFVYYGIIDRLSVRQFLRGTLMAVFGSGLAIFLSLMILAFQIAAVKGNVLGGFEHIVYSFEKRTHGDVQDYQDKSTANLESTPMEVIITYLKGTFFDFNNYVTTSNSFVSIFLFKIRYLYLVVLFLLMSIFLFYPGGGNASSKQRQRNLALAVATWVSILAPLSWHVIFKSHSYMHTHMNYILWQMPFTLFGFAVCGLAVKSAFSELFRLTKRC